MLQCMKAAIALLNAEKKPDYAKTAREQKLGLTAVGWRFEGKTVSRAELSQNIECS